MTVTTDMNIVIGQGTAIKEIHNVKKQNLEFNEKFISQQTDDKKKDDKSKVQESETDSRVEIRADEEEKKGKGQKGKKRDVGKERKEDFEELNVLEGNIIDITV